MCVRRKKKKDNKSAQWKEMPTHQFMGNSVSGIQHAAKEINMNYAKSWPVILLMMYISLKCRINRIEYEWL